MKIDKNIKKYIKIKKNKIIKLTDNKINSYYDNNNFVFDDALFSRNFGILDNNPLYSGIKSVVSVSKTRQVEIGLNIRV